MIVLALGTMITYKEELKSTARELMKDVRRYGAVEYNVVVGHVNSIAIAHDLTQRMVDDELGREMTNINREGEPEGWE